MINKDTYKRLTKKGGYTKELDLTQELGYSHIYNRLAELEDMIECGQLVFKSSLVSKYKNGDTVYCVLRGLENGMAYYVKEMKIRHIYLGKTKITYYLKGRKYGIGENQIFATKDEAEAKLEELKRGQND